MNKQPKNMAEPPTDFWPLVRLLADLDRKFLANGAYFDSGYCGACESCGEPPYPDSIYPQMQDAYLKLAALFSITTPSPVRCTNLMSVKKKKAVRT